MQTRSTYSNTASRNVPRTSRCRRPIMSVADGRGKAVGRAVDGERPAGAAVAAVDLQWHGAKKYPLSPQRLQVGQALDDDDAAAEENAVDHADLLQIIDVGHRRRLHHQQTDPPIDAPLGQLAADAGQVVAVDLRLIDAGAPTGPQQQPVAGPDFSCNWAQVGNTNQSPWFAAREIRDPGRSEASVKRDAVDRPVARGEVQRGVHVRAAVRVEVQDAAVPAVLGDGVELLELHAAHTVPDG